MIVLLIGLAVGVDYSMFYFKREREERAPAAVGAGRVEAAAATSGRAVLVSGLTVMVAMAGMFFTGNKTFESFGLATMIVVAVAVLGSLTVLPALPAKLGDRVDKPRVPLMGGCSEATARAAMWNAILEPALRRPLVGGDRGRRARSSHSPSPHCTCTSANPGVETVPKTLPS